MSIEYLHNNIKEFLSVPIYSKENRHKEGELFMSHIILGIIFLLVALLAVVSVIRQLKFKNYFALLFSAITALSFGFFSIATIISELSNL